MRTDWERFRDAVVVLAGGGPVKQRLTEAYQNHLRDLDPDELPRDLRGAYASLVTALQSGQRVGTLAPRCLGRALRTPARKRSKR